MLKSKFCVFLDVNACLKVFHAVFRRFFAWSFSMALSFMFSDVLGIDGAPLDVDDVQGGFFLD